MGASSKDTLHLLAVFHYAIAGLIALTACFPLIHLTAGMFLSVGGISNDEPAAGVVGAIFVVVAAILIVIGWSLAIFVFVTGKNLNRQVKYQLCVIGAGVVCVFMPLGTILGVFTLVTLHEDNVKQLFKKNEQPISDGQPDSV